MINILIYLTEGVHKADDSPLVRIEYKNINTMKKNHCIIFDQRFNHEGNAYFNSDKIFVRSELIFVRSELIFEHNKDKYYKDNYNDRHNLTKVTTNDDTAILFNKGCYMALNHNRVTFTENIFLDEIKKYSSECFDNAMMIRNRLTQSKDRNILLS